MPGRIEFTLGFKAGQVGHNPQHGETYRLYLLGNFSARANAAPAPRNIRKIDADLFDQVMAELNPTLLLAGGQNLTFTSLEAFHPDYLIQRIPILADLQQLRRELNNPQTAERAAAKIQAFFPSVATGNVSAQAAPNKESDDATLLRLLGKKPETTVTAHTSVDQWLGQLVAPHVSKAQTPQHQMLLTAIDTAMSQYLRLLLHREDFQALEALWRAVSALVNDEASDSQEIYLLDINRADLASNDNREQLTNQLKQHIALSDDEPEVAIVGDFLFAANSDDIELLAYFGQLAQHCGGRFISAAEYLLLAQHALTQADRNAQWRETVAEIVADSVILTYPRYLLRLPYSHKRDPIEAFDFDECPTLPAPAELLWGNSAFLCVRALLRSGEGSAPAEALSFAETPAFTFYSDGEQVLQPGVETVLTETQANALLDHGITPVIGFRQRQGVSLIGIARLANALT